MTLAWQLAPVAREGCWVVGRPAQMVWMADSRAVVLLEGGALAGVLMVGLVVVLEVQLGVGPAGFEPRWAMPRAGGRDQGARLGVLQR